MIGVDLITCISVESSPVDCHRQNEDPSESELLIIIAGKRQERALRRESEIYKRTHCAAS